MVAWVLAEREDSAITAALVSRACLREWINKGRKPPLVLHVNNSNAMRAISRKAAWKILGVLRSFSWPRLSNDKPCLESLFMTVKY